MLTFEDCLGLAAMTDEEVEAVSRHEHIPAIVALELGNELLRTQKGRESLRRFVVDDIKESQARNDCSECARFGRVLGEFLARHPDCRETGTDAAPELQGLIAIGRAEQVAEMPAELAEGPAAAARGIEDAKRCGDCSICAEMSLRLLRALKESGRAVGAPKSA